jgi:hypothetical protein
MNVMWELSRLTSRGGNSTRRILTYALAALTAAFLWTILISIPTHAATDATWNGDVITYDGNSYYGPASDTSLKSLSLPDKTKAYTYVDPAATTIGNTTAASRYIHVIYFAPDVDTNVATSAKYKTYIYQGPDRYSDPTFPTDVAIPQKSTSNNPGTSSCSVGSGLGWIICPITNFLASGMDWIFNVLSGFLSVRPVATNNDNALFRAWTYMRSFANIAFVIVFLIIIYSQLTSAGVSNYGIKKLIPRLVVAALLVNVSYYLCSIAVDISNVLGFSLQSIFIHMRNTLVGTEGNSWSVTSWQSVSGFILSGGTAASAGIIGVVTTVSTFGIGGSIILLLPALATGLVAVLVALVVMAARQAIVTILIIIAPLAFVAYLLPNTEKWFTKWRELLTTMLVLFPAFSVVFGGSQLAATAIIQNADSINIVILGMLVQVAPLFITPLLIRLSGSLLGKVAGLVNNPNKGIIDRTRKFAEDRAENIKAKRMSEQAKPYQFLRRTGQALDTRARRRKELREVNTKRADNRYNATTQHEALHEMEYSAEIEKKRIEQTLDRDMQRKVRNTPSLLRKEIDVSVLTDEVDTAKGNLDVIKKNVKGGSKALKDKGYDYAELLSDLADRSDIATRNFALTTIATQNAQRIVNTRLQQALLNDGNRLTFDGMTLNEYAGGIDIENGVSTAVTFAVNQQREAIGKLITERAQLIKHFKLDGGNRQKLAVGMTVNAKREDGTSFIFSGNDEISREAAQEQQLQTGSYEEIEEIVALSGIDNKTLVHRMVNGKLIYDETGNAVMVHGAKDNADGIGEAVGKYGVATKGMFLGGRFINNISRGDVSGEEGLNFGITMSILDGKIKAEDLANNDAGAIRRYTKVARDFMNGGPIPKAFAGRETEFRARIKDLQATATTILDPNNMIGNNASQATKNALGDMEKELVRRFR